MEVKAFQLIKIEKRPLLYLVLAIQATNFYEVFYNAFDIFSPKIKILSQQKVVFLSQSAVNFLNAIWHFWCKGLKVE